MKSLKGHFLVASAELADPNFAQTVVLLVDHNEEGAFGVVLNRPSDSTVKELWEKIAESEECENQQPVYVGGPVSGPLIALHAQADMAELEVVPGVCFAAQREHLEQLIRESDGPLRIFVGHSGWGSGQLENELRQGAWLTAEATAEFVFYEGSDLWRKVTKQVGQSVVAQLVGLRNLPQDPSLN
jgi:putative transcriptional regulator